MPHIVGIDLGTTNSALAFTEGEKIELFPIQQVVNPGEVRAEPLLPSFLYLPSPNEFAGGALALPWAAESEYVAGKFAQKRGLENSGRMVARRRAGFRTLALTAVRPCCPGKRPKAWRRFHRLRLRPRTCGICAQAWDAAHPGAPLDQQEVLVTVPASFDEVARELTQKAAEEAGYKNLTLLEEPQAAFYAWLARHPDWRDMVSAGDLILVIDIGGGTTDFSLIAVKDAAGGLELERVAVGEHILLGGDNIDLALARAVAARLGEKGTRIDNFQLQALWNNCRVAKEMLLDPAMKLDEVPVSIVGKGSGLVGGTIKAALQRADVDQVLEGFFPITAVDEYPQKRRGGLLELGLPYAADAAVTRHLARFLAHGKARRAAAADARAIQRRRAACSVCARAPVAGAGELVWRAGACA